MAPARVARRLLRRLGLDVVPFHPSSHGVARRARLFSSYAVDLVLDVGANVGQYGIGLRDMGYRGRIVSYEPLSSAFSVLREVATRDGKWEVHRVAAGRAPGVARLNVAANSQSSSMLAMLPEHLAHAPEAGYVAQEEVRVETLDALWNAHGRDATRPFVKIDAQGFEAPILDAAGRALERAVGVQVEMSIVPLYDGEELLPVMLERLRSHGFTLMSLDPVFSDRDTGRLLQVDGTFFRIER